MTKSPIKKDKKIFDFKEQLKEGNKGEQDFLKYYNKAIKAPDFSYDFDLEGKKIELKCDSYSLDKTENFFIERYSDYDKLKDGSVWQSLHCDFFVYYFILNKTFFWFKMKEFKEFLEDYIKDKSYILIKNKAWNTLGYKVNRDDCKKYIIKEDKF